MKGDLIAYLSDDELAVECEIRQLDPTAENVYETLRRRLEAEKSDPNLVPSGTHKLRTPRAEFQLIDEKLGEVLQFTNAAVDAIPPDTAKFSKISAQCDHYIDRLNRLRAEHSIYDKQAQSLIKRWKQLEIMSNPIGGDEDPTFDKTPGARPSQSAMPICGNVDMLVDNGQVTNEPWTTNPWTPMMSKVSGLPTGYSQPNQKSVRRRTTVDNSYGGDRAESEYDPRPTRPANTEPRTVNRRPKPHGKLMHNWHLSFDGDTNKLAVEEFAFRLEKLARADEIDLDRLPELLHIVLKGKAETWFWLYSRKNPESTWNDLKRDILKEFRTQSTDFEIRKQIEARRQRAGESFQDFRFEVEALNSKMQNPLPEAELVATLRLNISRRLKDFLMHRESRTIDDLRELIRPYEKLWAEDERIRARRAVNEIHQTDPNPDCGEYDDYDDCHYYQQSVDVSAIGHDRPKPPTYPAGQNQSKNFPTRGTGSANYLAQPKFPNSQTNSDGPQGYSTNGSGSNQPNRSMWSMWPHNLPCWNCGMLGHWHLRCKEPQTRLYCHGCGTENVPQGKCIRCNPHLNSSSGASGAVPKHPNNPRM